MEIARLIRKAFVIKAKPGMLHEYVDRHNPVWPALEAALRAHGVHNYSIFHRRDTDELFGYFEIVDEALFAQLSNTAICQQWWLYMTEVLECDSPNSKKGKEEQLEEVFFLA